MKFIIEYELENLKYDFLTVRLDKKNIPDWIRWIVENSNLYNFDHWFTCILDIKNNLYSTYDIIDMNNNKLCQVMITTEKNKRFDFFDKITIYWTFFNLYYDYLEYILWEFNLDNKSDITRVDIRIDTDKIGVMWFKFNDKIPDSHIFKNWNKTYNYIVRRADQWKRYKLRIYNKILDIIDKKLYMIKNNDDDEVYKDYISWFKNNDEQWILTRIELQLNSKYIKEDYLKLWDIYNIEKMKKIFYNIYQINLWDWTIKRSKKTLDRINIEQQEKDNKRRVDVVNHTTSMGKSYNNKIVEFWNEQDIFNYLNSIDINTFNVFKTFFDNMDYKEQEQKQIKKTNLFKTVDIESINNYFKNWEYDKYNDDMLLKEYYNNFWKIDDIEQLLIIKQNEKN